MRRELARAGCPPGTVVVSGYQEKGRGRVPGRSWISPPRESLLATVVLSISELGFPICEELPLRAGVAAALGIEDAAGIAVQIKWPNDVVAAPGVPAAGRKLAGLLCEAHGGTALVGIRRELRAGLVSAAKLPRRPARCCRSVAGPFPPGLCSPPSLARLQRFGPGTGVAGRPAEAAAPTGRGRPAWTCSDRGGRWQGTLLDIDERGRLVLGLSDGSRLALSQGELLPSP